MSAPSLDIWPKHTATLYLDTQTVCHPRGAMKESHPSKWEFGGILVHLTWSGEPARLLCWDESVQSVQQGDTVVAIQRPGSTLAVRVEPKGWAA